MNLGNALQRRREGQMIDPTKAILDWEQADQIMQDQRAEIARLRLTDDEREAIGMAYSRLTAIPHYEAVSATLRGLLERLG